MHCDSSYAELFAVEIEQRLTLAAHRLGIFRNQPSTKHLKKKKAGIELKVATAHPPSNADTYRAAILYSDCGRGLVSKDAESMGREDEPLLDFSTK